MTLHSKFKYLLVVLFFLSLMFSFSTKLFAAEKRPLDIVFCVDLSGSTNGLITDVRDNLWMIINQLNEISPAPNVRIGVVGFSRPSFKKSNSYVKVLSDLTPSFDHVASELYKLKPSIEKGDQIVSAAINTALYNISWSQDPSALKLIFLVGNGAVNTNGFEYVKACEQAVSKNVIINTVYIIKSLNWFDEISGWRRIANITGGMQFEMTLNKSDPVSFWNENLSKLEILNNELNNTFFWIGEEGEACKKEIVTADSGAFAAGLDAFANRVYYKTTDDFFRSLKNCELISKNDFSNSDANGKIKEERYQNFKDRIDELRQERVKKLINLKTTISNGPVNELYLQYKSTSFSDEGIFHRIILKVIHKQWKEK
jgi:hypothetical protein